MSTGIGTLRRTITHLPADGKWTFSQTYLVMKHFDQVVKRDYFNARPSGYHGAADSHPPTGTRARSVGAGYARRVGYDTYFGYYVCWNVDGHDWWYAHLKSGGRPSVGKQYPGGTTIGYTDNSGNSTGPHLHNEQWWTKQARETRCDPYWQFAWIIERKAGKSKHVCPYKTPANPSTTSSIARGEHSYRVMWVQWILGDSRIDGIFDAGLEARVKTFQAANGLTTPGRVGPKTWRKLQNHLTRPI